MSSCHGQDIRDAQNRLVYRLQDEARILSPMNKHLWTIKDDGAVVTSQKVLILRLKPDGKIVSASNREMGRIDSDVIVWESGNISFVSLSR